MRGLRFTLTSTLVLLSLTIPVGSAFAGENKTPIENVQTDPVTAKAIELAMENRVKSLAAASKVAATTRKNAKAKQVAAVAKANSNRNSKIKEIQIAAADKAYAAAVKKAERVHMATVVKIHQAYVDELALVGVIVTEIPGGHP